MPDQTDPRVVIYYCPRCGSDDLVCAVPPRDDHERTMCRPCGYVHYVGPAFAAGAILHDGASVCLVRRALEPGYGKWSVPGGFVDLGERPEDAARREVLEETGYRCRIERIIGNYAAVGPRNKQVVIAVYAARIDSKDVRSASAASEEVLDVAWFAPDEVPGDDEMAFLETTRALREFLTSFARE